MVEYRDEAPDDGKAAIQAAGAAINWRRLDSPAAIRSAAGLAAQVGSLVKPSSESQFWQQGRFTGMRIAKFQNWLYEQNRRWQFTDGALCALWCIEYTSADADYAARWDYYLPSVRNEYNQGRHQAPRPSLPSVSYGANGDA